MKFSSLFSSAFTALILIIVFSSCGTFKKWSDYSFPEPVDTSTKPIELQTKKDYFFANQKVTISNDFDGARVNHCELDDQGNFVITITAENTPINNSAYFGFRVWAAKDTTVSIILNYPEYNHRYIPKLSKDRKNWTSLSEGEYFVNETGSNCRFQIKVGVTPLFVCAQELHTSKDAFTWSTAKAELPYVKISSYGKSKLERNLVVLDIYEGEKTGKDCIAIVSRQHPPEVTGYLAMQAFVDAIVEENTLSKAYREKYRTIVMPMLNPDGVDLGHWRHSAGGIDLNRDWSKYRQPEILQATKYLVEETNKNKNNVLIGLDFHSTQKDIYYTLSDDIDHDLKGFKDFWIEAIGTSLKGKYVPNDAPAPLAKPISKGWFYLQFNAEGITYEVGDETPRDFVKLKADIAAREMMKLLIFK